MPPVFFYKGLIIGLSIAAPVGPVGVLCISRTLAQGRLTGLVSGLGAAAADAVYGSIAALGLTLIAEILVGQQFWLRLGGGVFMLILGLRIFRRQPAQTTNGPTATGLGAAFASTFFLTMTNPMTILAFAAIFAGLGVGPGRDLLSAAAMVSGVFVGSALWWLGLSGGVGFFRAGMTEKRLQWINRLAGTIIIAFGDLLLISLIA